MTMQRKAIFLDIDGTLNYNRPVPSAANQEAIRRARAAGHAVLLCTGRSMKCIPAPLLAAVAFDGVVAGGGAYVQIGERVIRSVCLSPDVLRRVCACYLREGTPCVLEGETEMFLIGHVGYREPDWKSVSAPDDFDRRYAGARISKLTIDGVAPPDILALLKRDFEVIQHPGYVEALPLGCGKAVGMQAALAELGIPRENSIALGDSRNDLDMLRYAGFGIAMGNAPDEVKAAADAVTLPCAADGVSAAIRRYVLEE